MIYLCLAILSSVLVSVGMRCSVNKVKNNLSMLCISYLTCLVPALLYLSRGPLLPEGPGRGTALFLGILAGALLLGGFILMEWNVKNNGVVLTATFAKLGVLVPSLLSLTVFHETLKPVQVPGFFLAILAILLIRGEKDSAALKSGTALVLLLLVNGSADGMAKVFEYLGSRNLEDQYLTVTFLSAFLLNLAVVLKKHQKIEKEDILYGILIGLPNFYSVRFLVKALEHIPAVITYPTYSVAVILIISLTGHFVFQESLNKRQKISMGMILLALVLLNLK